MERDLYFYDIRWEELQEQFIEMGQLKSDFDTEKFTVKKEGNFVAHNFHFLMRQYVLALSEARRMLIDREEHRREIVRWKSWKRRIFRKNADLELRKVQNQLALLEVTVSNKLYMIRYFEKCRLKLIEMNNGQPPTNAQYQKEAPKYWEWFAKRKILQNINERNTGVKEGILNLLDDLKIKPLINEDYQAQVAVPSSTEEAIGMAKELYIESRLDRHDDAQSRRLIEELLGEEERREVQK